MKLWGGRFEKETEGSVHAFSSSLAFDSRLAFYDLKVSEAHARALEGCGVLSPQELEAVVGALGEMRDELEKGTFPFADDEDIHTAVERVLVERTGGIGARLRTARSRNDQVAADLRLFVKDACSRLSQLIAGLMEAVLEQAEANLDAIMPGFTHLQPAQPVLLSHHLLAWFEMFKRDLERFSHARRQADVCPLGSGALAGVTFPLDRGMLAGELGFSEASANSIDAVADRDFAAEFLFACSLAAVHLSRVAEEVVIWCTPRFAFLALDEAYATGSSIMPQKSNPDVAELARGKTGRIIGHLVGLLAVLKGLPLAYNRDLQEDKEGLFDAADQLASAFEVMTGALATASFDTARLKEAAGEGFSNATDLADYLVRKGLPFLEAHAVAGRAVRLCVERGIGLEDLPLEDYRRLEPGIGEDVYSRLTPEACVAARDLPGGTAPARVREALAEARRWLSEEKARC